MTKTNIGKKVEAKVEEFKKTKGNVKSVLEHHVSNGSASMAVVTVASLLAGLFFLSPVLTGNAIGNLNENIGSPIGAILLAIGLLGSFILLRKKTFWNVF